MSKSKLFFKGSSGCIFRPQILCENSKKKKTRKRVSKLFPGENPEYKMGLVVKKIPGNKEWTILWVDTCKSDYYKKLLKNSEIKECLLSLNVNPEKVPMDYKFLIYQGSYGGLTFKNYSKKVIHSDIFNSKRKFIKIFLKIFKIFHNVFYGLKRLNEYNICHHDINIRNILVSNQKTYIIDYGESFEMKKLNQNNDLLNRMDEEFLSHRIYDSYPFEYIYHNMKDKKVIFEEQKNIAMYSYRMDYYDIYEPIHHRLFNVDTDNLRFELLEDKLTDVYNRNLYKLIKKLDVYSLGMAILVLFIERSEDYDISIDTVIQLFKSSELKPYMDLIKDMISFNYEDRIDIHTAYERYKNLI